VLSSTAALRERGDDFLFSCRQLPRLSRRQLPKLHRAEFRPYETLDLKIQRLAQPAYLSGASLRDGDLELPRTAPNASRQKFLWPYRAVLQLYTLHRCSCRCAAIAAHRGEVRSFHFGAGMCQFVRRFTVIGQEKQSLGHVIEPPDVGETGAVFDDVENGFAAAWIGPRRQDAGGLVQYQPGGLRGRSGDGLSVDQNLVARRVDGLANEGNTSIDSHTPRRHQIVRRAAGGDSGARDRALNPHRLGHQSARGGASPLSLAGAAAPVGVAWRGARSAIASSSARGSSSRWRSANCSRNEPVVP